MYRIIKLTQEEPQRTTVSATRKDLRYAATLMRKAADKHLLPGYVLRRDSTLMGGYYADAIGDCIICEQLTRFGQCKSAAEAREIERRLASALDARP